LLSLADLFNGGRSIVIVEKPGEVIAGMFRNDLLPDAEVVVMLLGRREADEELPNGEPWGAA
jgi:hypothetical protein